jgi:multidrug efflux system membrane fusion protein
VVVVSAQTDGAVVEVPAEKGSQVRTGDVLAILDGADRASRLAEAKALLEQRAIETEAAKKLSDQGFAPKLNLADLAAKVALARAAVAAMEVDVSYLTITAPIDGTLDERPAEIGQFLQRGDAVATLVDLDPIVIVGNATEQDVGSLSLGIMADVRLLDGRVYQGQIRFIAARADEGTRTFRIEVAVPNSDHQILDGLSAELTLPLGRVMAHHVSPAVLSLGEDGEVGVKFVDAQDVVRFMPVSIVREDKDGIWLAGLPNEARLIVVGQDFVIEGQKVAPVEAGPSTEPAAP